MSELRITFKPVAENIFCDQPPCLPGNELVARIQPDEALYLTITSKEPGLNLVLTQTDLNLKYQSMFKTTIPDAYDSLLLDVLQNDRSLFIRKDELDAAWDIFTPVLRDIDESGREPELYPLGWDPDAE
jgi:glucose-6-phosphate 1-dehydrogenase